MPSFSLIDLGTTANDGTGDNLRVAGEKVNDVITYVNGTSASLHVKNSSNITAEAGQAIYADTSSSSFEITLPAVPVFGDTVHIWDYAGTFGTNSLSVVYDGTNKIGRAAANYVLSVNDTHIQLTFVDTATGWLVK